MSQQGLHSHHPIFDRVTNARDVDKFKAQVKLLAGDLYLNDTIGERNNTSKLCLFCPAIEDEAHVFGIRGCEVYKETRERIINDVRLASQQCLPPLEICFDDDQKFIPLLSPRIPAPSTLIIPIVSISIIMKTATECSKSVVTMFLPY